VDPRWVRRAGSTIPDGRPPWRVSRRLGPWGSSVRHASPPRFSSAPPQNWARLRLHEAGMPLPLSFRIALPLFREDAEQLPLALSFIFPLGPPGFPNHHAVDANHLPATN